MNSCDCIRNLKLINYTLLSLCVSDNIWCLDNPLTDAFVQTIAMLSFFYYRTWRLSMKEFDCTAVIKRLTITMGSIKYLVTRFCSDSFQLFKHWVPCFAILISVKLTKGPNNSGASHMSFFSDYQSDVMFLSCTFIEAFE